MASPVEIAWLAGLLEGDGSFDLHKNSPTTVIPQIRIAMLDKDIIERVSILFEGSSINNYLTPKGDKVMWRTTIAKRYPTQNLLVSLYPFMGERRKEKIGKMLNWYIQNPIKPKGPKALGGVPRPM